jgi:hypothetical protein
MTDPQPQEKQPEQGKPQVPHGEPVSPAERPLKTQPEKAPISTPAIPVVPKPRTQTPG